MDEVLRKALNVTTKDQLREVVSFLTPEQRLHLLACAIDVAQAARVLHREYVRDHANPNILADYLGIPWNAWPEVKPKWEDLGFALVQFFGSPLVVDKGPRPPWLDVHWGESVMARCNIPRHGPIGIPQAGV